MSSKLTLTQAEADALIAMLKKTLADSVTFPSMGKPVEFNVRGNSERDIFTVNIYRGRTNRLKCDIGARIKKNGIMLLALHIEPGGRHINPDGEKITGSHWHLYNECYGMRFAYPAKDIHSENFYENTMEFLKRFNIIERPVVYVREEMA